MSTPYAPPPYPALAYGSGGGLLSLQTAVAGGDPNLIRWYAQQIVTHSKKLIELVAELERKKKELEEVWPEGRGRDQAAEKVAAGIESFLKAIQPLIAGAGTVAGTGEVVQASQNGMNGLAGIEQLVAGLLSNPWTHSQGVATAGATVGMLSQLFTGLGTVFTALGQTQLGQFLTQLGTVTGAVQQLITSADGSGSGTTSPTPATASTTPYATTPTATTPDATNPYGTNPYAGTATDPYGTNPYGTPTGYPSAYATGPDGLPYGYAIDPATGSVMASGYHPTTGQPYGSGELGEWVPVDLASDSGGGSGGSGSGSGDGGSGEANGGGSGDSASTGGDDPTVVTVSSAGESVTFEVAATDPTTITAEVGADDSPTEVSITVTPA
ncbi:MAG: hypothetical protein ACFCVG_13655 [Kineosporiaceae bacterium]